MTSDYVTMALLLVTGSAMISVMYDIMSYTDRQNKWEREHPGARYVRGYRKMRDPK